MSTAAEERYGSPQLTIHRADLLNALTDRLPANRILFGCKVTGVEQDDTKAPQIGLWCDNAFTVALLRAHIVWRAMLSQQRDSARSQRIRAHKCVYIVLCW